MKLYFISAPDPTTTDSLDTFVHANTEMSAYHLWLTYWQNEGRLPADELSPNYDLYLVPHDPDLPNRSIEGVIPWSLDGTPANTTIQLVSSSWMEPDRKPVGLNVAERSSIMVALAISQQTLRSFAADLRTRLLAEPEEKALRFLDAELARILAVVDRIKESGES